MQRHSNPDPLVGLELRLDLPHTASAAERERELERRVGAGSRTRVLVIADDPLVRDGFATRLGDGAAGEARADDVGAAIERTGANVVLWDLGPYDGAPLPAFAGLEVPVVALSPAGTRALEVLARGAQGVLRRDASGLVLQRTIETVLQGLVVIAPELLQEDLDAVAEPLEVPSSPAIRPTAAEALTPREREVLQLVAAGLSNKKIAHRLGISSHTAKFHIGAILAKLDADSRTEAVVRAVQRGLVMV